MSGPLYTTHLPLHPLQRAALGVLAAAGALARPARADLVATVAEVGPSVVLERIRQRMQAHPVGRDILRDRPVITDEELQGCWALPPHTFGGAYAQFMGVRNFHANDRPPVRFVDDPELAYVLRRMREVHDFWHVLFGCHTNVFGELALKAVEFVQTGVPMTGLAVLGAQWRLPAADRALLNARFLPWALRAGNQCSDLMCVYYERHFQDDLDEMRRALRITPAPLVPEHLRLRAKPPPAPSGA